MDQGAQISKAEAFAKLHKPGDPIVLVNIWDVASAGAVAKAGAKALATSSVAVAQAQGFDDGEQLPRERLIDTAARIAAGHDLPLTVDSEAGYGATPDIVSETVRLLIGAGAIGMNLEDQVIGGSRLFDAKDQAARIRAAREAANSAGIPFFINARTDIFLKAPRDAHGRSHVEEALERARVYAQAGASGFFVPGLVATDLLRAVCEASPLPVNVMASPLTPPLSRLGELGVARVSLGPFAYRHTLKFVTAFAADYLARGIVAPL